MRGVHQKFRLGTFKRGRRRNITRRDSCVPGVWCTGGDGATDVRAPGNGMGVVPAFVLREQRTAGESVVKHLEEINALRTYGLRGSLLWAHARVQAAVVRCPRTHGRGARGLDLDAFVHRTRSTVKLPFPIPRSRPWANARSRTRVCATRVRKRDPNERATARPYCNDIASLRARQLKFVPPNHPPDHTALKGARCTVHGAA